MTDQADGGKVDLEQFREYLALLARLQVDPRLQGKVDLSGVIQQTLLEAHQAIERLASMTPAQRTAWLRRALSNNLTDVIRKLNTATRDVRREQSLESALEESSVRMEAWLVSGEACPAEQAVRNEQLLYLAQALNRLSEDQRRVVELHYLHGWPVSEVAKLMDRSDGAIGALLVRGIKKLRESLRELQSNDH